MEFISFFAYFLSEVLVEPTTTLGPDSACASCRPTLTVAVFVFSSSTNAKKWETELQTLKNNNARLTAALQESTTNVEEWKKQLNAYKEESVRLRKKVN